MSDELTNDERRIDDLANDESTGNDLTNDNSRRQFLKNVGKGLLAAGLSGGMASQIHAQAGTKSPTSPKPIELPPINAPTEQQTPPPAPLPPAERVGFAVVGLGRLSLEELLPAFGECKKARRARKRRCQQSAPRRRTIRRFAAEHLRLSELRPPARQSGRASHLVEDLISFRLRFPSGVIADNVTSYDAHRSARYRVHATGGWFGLNPAFLYRGLQMETARAEGAVERIERPRIQEKNQFATEMDHMAECVLENKRPFTPGEEGLQDHRIIEAIYEAARTNRPVKLRTANRLDAFRGTEPNV